MHAVNLAMAAGQVAPGGVITLPVTTNLTAGALSGAGTIEVRYDPAVVDAIACVADPQGRFDAKYCNVNYNHDGSNPDVVRFNLVSGSGATGQLTLANISFRAVGPAGSSSGLNLIPAVVSDPAGAPLPVGEQDGQVCVAPCNSPTPTPVATAVASAQPSSSVTITLPNTGGQITLPAGLVTATTVFTYSQFITPAQDTDSFAFAGKSFTLVASDAAGQPITSFSSRYTVTLNYQDIDWQAAGIPAEENLNLYYWNGTAWVAILPCAGCALDTVNNRITAVLDHLTEFALLGNPLAAPVVNASRTSSGVELRWTQVGGSVTRYEVYQSVKPYFVPGGTDSTRLKEVTAPGVGLQASCTDSGPFAAGSAYYYAVVAIGTNTSSSPPSAPKAVFTFGLVAGQS